MKKTILITGCTTGIGREAAKFFADKGWNVVATGRSKEKLDAEFAHENIATLTLDVTNAEHIAEAVRYVETNYESLDALVNNAGYGAIGPFEAASDEEIRKQFDVNVFGVMTVTKAFLPLLRQHKGTIVSISSIGGRMSFPLFNLYHSTKWALEGFMESLQYELAPHGVRVKLVEPGPIQSEFNGSSQKLIKKANLNMYNEFVAKVYPVVQAAGSTGRLPIDVARVIYKATTSASAKLRYGVADARLLLLLRKLLPDRLFQFVVKNIFRIQ